MNSRTDFVLQSVLLSAPTFDQTERDLQKRPQREKRSSAITVDARWQRIVRATWRFEQGGAKEGIMKKSSSSLFGSTSLPYCRRLVSASSSGKQIIGDDIEAIANNYDGHRLPNQQQQISPQMEDDENPDALLECPPHGIDGRIRRRIVGTATVGEISDDGGVLSK